MNPIIRRAKKLATYTAVICLLLASASTPLPAIAAGNAGELVIDAPESAPISGPSNPNSLSYSFGSRWNSLTGSVQQLGVTMPMSANGMVNVVDVDIDTSRLGAADRSQSILSREIFNDELERAGESTLTLQGGQQVMIGTTLGELVNVSLADLQTTAVGIPAGTASSILNMYDDGPNVLLGTRSATYRQSADRGSGQVLKLKYSCVYAQCNETERWTRYGAPVAGNTHVYGVSSWRGAVIAASGDQRAVLSIYQNGEWQELDTVPASGAGQAERFTQARVMGDYLYASYQGTNTTKYGTHVYRLSQDANGLVAATWVRNLGATAWIVSPVAPGMGYSESSILYRGPGDSLTIFDPLAPPTGANTVWGVFKPQQMPEGSGLGALPTSSCWMTPAKMCATWNPGGSDIVLATKAGGSGSETIKQVRSISAGDAVVINGGRRSISRLAAGPGNSGLFASTSYFGHYVRQINPNTGQTKDRPLRSNRDSLGGAPQVEGLGAVGDQLLAGIYPQGGTISQIDPAKPVTCENQIDRSGDDCNPTITTGDRIIGFGQARPVAIADLGGGRAAIASYGARNNAAGALTLYNTTTKKITDRIPLQDANGIKLSEMGLSTVADRDLAATGGWIYAGTNAAPPDNTSTQPRAAVIRYNVTTKVTEAIEVSRKLVSALKFGADGRLYAMTGYSFLTIDPGLDGRPFAVVDSINIGTRWSAPGASMAALADGTFAVVAGSGDTYPGPLYLVDPRGAGKARATSLGGEEAYGVVVVSAPSGLGSRWYYTRGFGIFYQDQPQIAGPLR
ncbi:hypothetical protein [Arthrobacter russicus]|uniref:Uncharacterized protein n=1 Tax=Arthrobacter russicus TaxID=172040 RepID=A0ABU1JC87_9MICC|nr:hypothetical protein [Arthrobacter russicus]MDN5669674.1 hypothetical protein [Renibacterium salmoninarum]MDR6270035.1 hypothetical protein [Arthrobacter russicus]